MSALREEDGPRAAGTRAIPGEASGPDVRAFMRAWATGVAVVTGTLGGEPAGCTVNAFLSVSLRPPLLLVSLADGSRTLAAVAGHGAFGINVLGWDQRQLAGRFAGGAARHADRFAGTPWRMRAGAPVLEGAVAACVCVRERLIGAADHTLVLGRPVWTDAGVAAEPGAPVVYHGNRYQPLPSSAGAVP
ncbi:flavin reductase family protein [Streptomyces albiaxialis]|uniref:Flavin reductase family protein n=1 Tax=Streptomyces albiaxialis TaxID=329523 RepID=A0ABP5I2L6_9ACTN